MADPFDVVKAEEDDPSEVPAEPDQKGLDPSRKLQNFIDSLFNNVDVHPGEWLYQKFGDRPSLFKEAMVQIFSAAGIDVTNPYETVAMVPQFTGSFSLRPWQLSFQKESKTGGWPPAITFRGIVKSVASRGFDQGRDPLNVRFPADPAGTRSISDFSVLYVDGWTKSLSILVVMAAVAELDLSAEEIQMLTPKLVTFARVPCYHKVLDTEEKYIFESLKLQYETAQKQQVGPLDLVYAFRSAVAAKQKVQPHRNTSDLLEECMTEYNALVTKSQKMNGDPKKVVVNLLSTSEAFLGTLNKHYNKFRHENSGIPMDILADSFFLVGNSRAKPGTSGIFKEILVVTEASQIMWASRVVSDYERKLPSKKSSIKAQKYAQAPLDAVMELLDVTLLWTFLRGKLVAAFGEASEQMTMVDGMWRQGTLDMELRGACRAADPEWCAEKSSIYLELAGKATSDVLEAAQNQASNARVASLQAAFTLFKSELVQDEMAHEREILANDGDLAKKRSALVAQLEEMHVKGWELVQEYVEGNFPCWTIPTARLPAVLPSKLVPWLEGVFTSSTSIRRQEEEYVIVIFNCTTMGVMSSMKTEWMCNFVTSMMSEFPRNGVAVILHPNRSASRDNQTQMIKQESAGTWKLLGESGDRDVDMKREKNEVNQPPDEDDRQGEEEDEEAEVIDAELRDVRHLLETKIASRDRGLLVKPLNLVFDSKSIYGCRPGCYPGLIISARVAGNAFHRSSAWRHGTVQGAVMTPRHEMRKPMKQSRASPLSHGLHFTDVQEKKQVCSGSSVINCIVEGLLERTKIPASSSLVLIDGHGYDGSMIRACLANKNAQGAAAQPRRFCATICHDDDAAWLSLDGVHQLVGNMAKTLQIKGYPDTGPVIEDLNKLRGQGDFAPRQKDLYRVCQALPCGALCVLQSHVDRWLNEERFKAEMQAVLESHDKRFNPAKKKIGEKRSAEPLEDQPPEKRVKLLQAEHKTKQALLEHYNNNVFTLDVDGITFFVPHSGTEMYMESDSAKTVPRTLELFSFGSGSWREGSEASRVCRDLEEQWLLYAIHNDSALVSIEAASLPPACVKTCSLKIQTIKQLLMDMELGGEVRVSLYKHNLERSSTGYKITPDEQIAFVLARPQLKKDQAPPLVRKVNLGAKLRMARVRQGENLDTCWQLRAVKMKDGRLELVPSRPCAHLKSSLSLSANELVRVL